MRVQSSFRSQLLLVALATSSSAATLADVCTVAFAKSALPTNYFEFDSFSSDIIFDASSLTTTPIYNSTASGSEMYPDAIYDYCNVTFAYSHAGLNDRVQVTYWLPSPDKFQNRYLSTGGGGYSINSGSGSVAGGIGYGASAGLTDGGFGCFDNSLETVFSTQQRYSEPRGGVHVRLQGDPRIGCYRETVHEKLLRNE